jgi:hypothetical protein
MTWGSLCCILLSARGNVRAINHTHIDYNVFTFKNKIGFQIIVFFSEGRKKSDEMASQSVCWQISAVLRLWSRCLPLCAVSRDIVYSRDNEFCLPLRENRSVTHSSSSRVGR